ncbi:MAG: hypothetical protein ACD_79C00074G0001, partial [uncultured bacterium]
MLRYFQIKDEMINLRDTGTWEDYLKLREEALTLLDKTSEATNSLSESSIYFLFEEIKNTSGIHPMHFLDDAKDEFLTLS